LLWQTISFSSRIHSQNQTHNNRSPRVTDPCLRGRATSRRHGLRKPRTGRTTSVCRSTSRSSGKRTFRCSRPRPRTWRSCFKRRGRWPLTNRRGRVSPFLFYDTHKSPGFEVHTKL